ncbi:MAG: tRNA pseudouridine(55) synthase TruB [Bacilli bacterium]|nr:tRNA pseudouridine(55) synthase TruB [Bacilli bacterium]
MLNGIILLDKEEGLTSRTIDNKIQRLFETRKVGHLGTLDPFATGLLVIGVNKGTKCLTYIDDSRKTYVATLVLGKKTSTGDLTGEIIEEKEVKTLDLKTIEDVLASFLGKGEQIPPMTSAIKVNGQALYKIAHKGGEVERKPRPIEIFSIRVIEYKDNILVFETEVSRGTYIRVLGEDIALKLGTVGYLSALRRTKVDNISIEDAVKIGDLTIDNLHNAVNMISIPHYDINDVEYQLVMNGRKLWLKSNEEKLLLVHNNECVAVYSKFEDKHYQPERGLF